MSSSPLTGEYMSQADIMNLIMRLTGGRKTRKTATNYR
jgi:hypothetical protein